MYTLQNTDGKIIMLKNFLFDMDGTLIDCTAEKFIPLYKQALADKFAANAEMKKIIETVLIGASAMVANDGSRTNRETFMEFARGRLALPPEELEKLMTEFYADEYAAVKSVIAPKPAMIEAVQTLKAKGYRLVVTTNPLFPAAALVRRLEWGGYDRADFDFVTSYETSTYAKPSVGYYTETLKRLDLDPAETIIVGNDMDEDVNAGKEAGMQTYWLTDTPIPSKNPTAPDLEGTSDDFLTFAKQIAAVK